MPTGRDPSRQLCYWRVTNHVVPNHRHPRRWLRPAAYVGAISSAGLISE
jgi:hypothetical protein